mmetsp:Transcript_18293/g.31303  ORF Transcript_18293/g.31303 Transcript_18293/m.31303 type:complete len:87 (-) Transcript_18293:307-567(-)
MNMEDEDREKCLKLTETQMQSLAENCNRYPNMELELKGTLSDNELSLEYEVRRDIDEGDFESRQDYLGELKTMASPVNSQTYPLSK